MATEVDAAAAVSSPATSSPLSPPATSPLPNPSLSVTTAPLPLQTAPPPAFYTTPAYMHAMRVENAHINLPVHLAMNGANYTVWRGMMLDVIDQYDVASWIAPNFADHAGDACWSIVNKAVKRWFLSAMVMELAAFMLDRETTAKIIEKSPTPVPFDVAVGMLLHDEIGNNFAGSTHHSALAVQQRGSSPAPSGVAPGGQARPPAPGLGGGKPSSPSPNQGHNKRRRYTNNGGYQGAATSPPPWTG
ncbi:uncharacterized protein [Triticum aestivum]|uniref:uncharacterized protein n=1 Tax=Triticum aestivum TaxID=4565 RepID=UPI001D021B84|nr:uncharacterized protein LOC123151577 [Triticum aestivum]